MFAVRARAQVQDMTSGIRKIKSLLSWSLPPHQEWNNVHVATKEIKFLPLSFFLTETCKCKLFLDLSGRAAFADIYSYNSNCLAEPLKSCSF